MAYDVSDGNVINPHTRVSTQAEQAAAAAIPSQFGSIRTKKRVYKVRELQNHSVVQGSKTKRKKPQLFSKLPQIKERKCNDWLSSVRIGGLKGLMVQELDDRALQAQVRVRDAGLEMMRKTLRLGARRSGTNRGPRNIQKAQELQHLALLLQHPLNQPVPKLHPVPPSRCPAVPLQHVLAAEGAVASASQVCLSVAHCLSSKLCSRGNGEEVISPTVGRRQRWMGRQLCA